MKNFLLLNLLLFCGILAYGQRFKVESFEKDESDLAARKNDRKDINGNACALIKIMSDVKGLGIDASMGIVGDVEFKRGAYWVYLSPGEQRLEIFKSGYVKLVYKIPLPVQSYDVFHMVLLSKGIGKALPVTFMTEPKDVTVKVDTMMVAPNETHEVEIGEHRISVSKRNYKTLDTTITVDKKHVLFRFALEEVEDAALIITSEPDGARIFVEGVEIGKTPVSTFYKPGTYSIRLTKEKFVPIEEETIRIAGPQTQKHYNLKENVGFITIKTWPEASVLINGQSKPLNTKLKYSPKLLDVEIQIPKAKTFNEQIILKRNDEKVIEYFPDIPTGTIQVGVTPLDASIRIKSERGEVYTSEGMKIFKDIHVGTYEITVSKPGYSEKQLSVTLKEGQKITKSIKLKKHTGSYTSAHSDKHNEFVRIAAGTLPGQYNPDGRRKSIDAFLISKYEITFQQYVAFLNAVKSTKNGVYQGKQLFDPELEGFPLTYKNGSFRFSPNDEVKNPGFPVFGVTWFGARAYCEWAGGRLPTADEWLLAASAGSAHKKYSGGSQLNQVAWYYENSQGRIREVGLKQPNESGVYDMTGNLWEWCDSNGHFNAFAAEGPSSKEDDLYRFIKGGAVDCQNKKSMHIATTLKIYPYASNRFIGFRMVKNQ